MFDHTWTKGTNFLANSLSSFMGEGKPWYSNTVAIRKWWFPAIVPVNHFVVIAIMSYSHASLVRIPNGVGQWPGRVWLLCTAPTGINSKVGVRILLQHSYFWPWSFFWLVSAGIHWQRNVAACDSHFARNEATMQVAKTNSPALSWHKNFSALPMSAVDTFAIGQMLP